MPTMPNTAKTQRRSHHTGDSRSVFVAYISRVREIMLLAVSSVSRDMQLIYISKPSLRMKPCLHGIIRSCIVSPPSKDRVSPIPCVRIAWHTNVPTPSRIHIRLSGLATIYSSTIYPEVIHSLFIANQCRATPLSPTTW